MPTLSIFCGIVIRMYANDHGPAHFHALYAEHEALFDAHDLRVIRGSLPHRAMALVLEWAADHRTSCWRIGTYAANDCLPNRSTR